MAAAAEVELELSTEGGVEGDGEADDDAGGLLKGGAIFGMQEGLGDGAAVE